MKWINCNVSGTPTDTPRILDDTGRSWDGVFNNGNARITFELPLTATGGGHLQWLDKNVNFLIPGTGAYEGASLGLPTIIYGPSSVHGAIQIVNNKFEVKGQPWIWKGTTEMLAPWRMLIGQDINGILDQRVNVGANIVRSLAMGWPFIGAASGKPSAYANYWDIMRSYFDKLDKKGLALEWVIFAGTRPWMPDPNEQMEFYHQTCNVVREYPHVVVELLNEAGHGSQSIDPGRFSKPDGIVASHGSGLTDAPPVSPLWDYATYHARRDSLPDARGITNVDPLEFEAYYPKIVTICEEMMKPEQYNHDTHVAYLMGRHGGVMEWGSTFHSQQGVESLLFPTPVAECAKAFYEGLEK